MIEDFLRVRSQRRRARLHRRLAFDSGEGEHRKREITNRIIVIHRQLHFFERLILHHLLGGV